MWAAEEHFGGAGEEESGEVAVIVQPNCNRVLLSLSSGIPVPMVSSSPFTGKQIYRLG